jgi:ribonuclease D
VSPTIKLHMNDLPAGLDLGKAIAVDTETLGLQPRRDRLCVVQLSAGDGNAHLVQFDGRNWEAPRLKALLGNASVLKIFHFARFDVAVLSHYLGVVPQPLYCTKIASKLVRTYTDRHGLKDLCHELLGVDLSKQQQSSDWAAETLTDQQKAYAASDVLHLHALKAKLSAMLQRENRESLADACFRFLPVRARLDLEGFSEMDIFAH